MNFLSRRDLLGRSSAGFGLLALAGLTTEASAEAPSAASSPGNPLAPKSPHFAARAERVIFLCMQGGPSHVDTFDHKAALDRDHGKPGKYGGRLLKSPFKFAPRGESGLQISDLFAETAAHADDLCLIRSMQCDQPVHTGAMTQMHTGTAQFIRPSIGSWTLYGLGTENESLPGFISIAPPAGASRNYASAFLPAIYGGTKIGRSRRFAGGSQSMEDIAHPRLSKRQQRRQLDFIQTLNRESLRREGSSPEIEGVIESFELAFRMQDAVPELMDLSSESAETLAMYGVDEQPTDRFGRQCLMARRMAEAGVRFIEVTHGNWDQHVRLSTDHPTRAAGCDRPIAGLLADLKRRGMLEDTLVIWGGEFGRTPAAQGTDGRNHNHKGYTTWMAGGGVKGGMSYGSTDEHGYAAVEDPCHIHDWHATILHLLGLDHTRLTYNHAGRDYRLTDVHGNVINDIFA